MAALIASTHAPVSVGFLVDAEAHPAVRALTLLESQAPIRKGGPRLSAGAKLLSNLADLFFDPKVRMRVPWLWTYS